MAKPKQKAAPKKKPGSLPAVVRKPRRVPLARYKSFHLRPRIKSPKPPLPSSWRIIRSSLAVLKREWRVVVGLTLVYGLINLIVVRRFQVSFDLTQVKDLLNSVAGDSGNQVSTATSLFGDVIRNSTSTPDSLSAAYQSIAILVSSLAIIWFLRQAQAGKKVGVRRSFYSGMYPLVPFVIILVALYIQSWPMSLGLYIYANVIVGGVATTGVEILAWGLLAFLLGLLSLYMMSSSLFALFITTLPEMGPMKALRSARELVQHRRFVVLRRVLFLPVALLAATAIVIIPLIMFAAPLAEWTFFVMSLFAPIVVLSYLYQLYRELLS